MENLKKISQLKSAIEEGIKSGRAENFNPEKHLLMLKAKKSLEKMNEIPPSSE